jgi:hypothetical protein
MAWRGVEEKVFFILTPRNVEYRGVFGIARNRNKILSAFTEAVKVSLLKKSAILPAS